MKTCGKCKITKSVDNFSKETKNNDGLQYNCRNCKREDQSERLENDINYRLAHGIRTQTKRVLLKESNKGKWIKIIGRNSQELKAYIEGKFQPGMTWENYGEEVNNWQIDHIQSLKHFTLSNPEEFLEAANYLNLQPLWSGVNRAKGTKNGN